MSPDETTGAERVDVALVVAVSQNGVIGADGDMPWRLPSDLRHFKSVTMGKPVIMGRKTYESIGKALPGRLNIVVTRQSGYRAEGAEVTGDLATALEAARMAALRDGVSEICVIGGGEIYRQTLDRADRIYFTEVHAVADGDTVFPELAGDVWRETDRTRHEAGERDSADFSFVVYERVMDEQKTAAAG